jgi:hypothetical protein
MTKLAARGAVLGLWILNVALFSALLDLAIESTVGGLPLRSAVGGIVVAYAAFLAIAWWRARSRRGAASPSSDDFIGVATSCR